MFIVTEYAALSFSITRYGLVVGGWAYVCVMAGWGHYLDNLLF